MLGLYPDCFPSDVYVLPTVRTLFFRGGAPLTAFIKTRVLAHRREACEGSERASDAPLCGGVYDPEGTEPEREERHSWRWGSCRMIPVRGSNSLPYPRN